MNDPSLSPGARRALEVFQEQTAAPLPRGRKETLWHGAVAASTRSSNPLVLKALLLAGSCVVGAAVVTGLRGIPGAEVEAAPGAQWHRQGDSVTLARGRLRLLPRERLAVVTPQLQAVLQNAVALFDVSPEATVVAVESGEVAWRTPRKSGVLRAGERITVEAPPPPSLTVAPGVPAVDGCAPGPQQQSCLEREAQGLGLAAQTALYALGMLAHEQGALAEAIRLFRAYGERFPDGVFAPEASIALIVDLERDGQRDQARSEAARFSARFPGEPRAEDVARWGEQTR